VERILTDKRLLLKLALLSITESVRNNPGKFNFLFDSMSSSITPIDYYGSSQNYSPYTYSYKQYSSQDNYAKVYTDTLLDEAECAIKVIPARILIGRGPNIINLLEEIICHSLLCYSKFSCASLIKYIIVQLSNELP
jgi:hypothetical protein